MFTGNLSLADFVEHIEYLDVGWGFNMAYYIVDKLVVFFGLTQMDF